MHILRFLTWGVAALCFPLDVIAVRLDMTSELQKCSEDASRLREAEQFNETVLDHLLESVVKDIMNKRWLTNAKKFIADTFSDRETSTRVAPPLSYRASASLVSFLFEFGKRHGEIMFIIYSRDMEQFFGFQVGCTRD